jgi:CDP-paratose synthetase
MGKKILITGITGFLGSHLAKALLAKGYEIIALKRESSSFHRIESILSKITFYDIEDLDFSVPFKEHKIETVIHTATCYGRNGETISEIFEANTAFPLRLLNEASLAGVSTFINTDTILDKYLNIYSLSKNQLLEWGQFFSIHNKIHFTNMRLEHLYGPDDDDSKFTTYVIKSCLENIPELRLTLGEQKRDFIFIDDVVSAYIILLEMIDNYQECFMEFDVGSGHSVTIREFVETVHQISHSSTNLLFGALPYRIGEVMFSNANIGPLNKLGWTCKTSLEQGLKFVIESNL